MSRKPFLAAIAAAFALSVGVVSVAQAGSTKVFFPTKEKPAFSLVVPDGWDLQPAEEQGGFMSVIGPSGIMLSMRTVSAKGDELKDAEEESVQWVKDNYNEVTMVQEPKETKEAGHDAILLTLSGKDKSDGHKVAIVMELVVLNANTVADIQAFIDAGDKEGVDGIGKIMDTFTVH
jgi:ABC-type sugar transport system substrate-binding protein